MTTPTPGLEYFKLTGYMDAVVTDEVDANLVPDRKGINARVIVTPLVDDKPYPEVVATIEKLHGLMEKGILAKEEFEAKKAELLKKLV